MWIKVEQYCLPLSKISRQIMLDNLNIFWLSIILQDKFVVRQADLSWFTSLSCNEPSTIYA